MGSRNGGGHDAKTWGNQNQNMGSTGSGSGGMSRGRPTHNTDSRRANSWGNSGPQSSFNRGLRNDIAPPPPVNPPPLNHGWAQAASGQPSQYGLTMDESHETTSIPQHVDDHVDENNIDDDSEEIGDSDDELLSDEFDSDSSVKGLETQRKSKWFKAFFDSLDKLTAEEIDEPAGEWHCPACKGGVGAIKRYIGLNPLIAHAKTKRSKRVKLHRQLAELLEEELRTRGTSVVPAGEAFGKWNGLNGDGKDHMVVWPPMLIIMNTRLDKNENGKWIGMGNEELLNHFPSFKASKARHSYGPQGHRGISVLIFESSAVGYLEAERLDKLFRQQSKDREAWDRLRGFSQTGGKRQLYGYLAEERDLDIFNQHSQGKAGLKFEMRSHQEMVVRKMDQMNLENQQLTWLKDRVATEQRHSKVLEEHFVVMSRKYRKTEEENRIIRQMSKKKHEEDKEEKDFQEQFYKDQLRIQEQSFKEQLKILEARDAEEESFEKLQWNEREKVKQTNADFSTLEDHISRVEEFINIQEKEAGEFVEEREKLIKDHEDKKIAMKLRQREEEVELQAKLNALKKGHGEEMLELEKSLNIEINRLMERFTPTSPNEGESSGSVK